MEDDDGIHQVIEPIVSYYRKLDSNGRKKFIQRVQYFASNFEFEGVQGFEITDSVKYLLCCPLAQITFGLDEFDMQNFPKIIVIPTTLYAPLSKINKKKRPFDKSTIVISWDSFYKAYLYPEDNYNSGLHEFANAYKLSIDSSKQFDSYLEVITEEYTKVGNEVFYKMRSENAESFLRMYAGTNGNEVFAMCIEYFFGVPQKLMSAYPDLYAALCNLLNQNPLNIDQNYFYNNESGMPQEFRKKSKKIFLEAENFEPSNYVFPFLLSGIFTVFGWVPFMYLLDHQLISITNTLLLVLAIGLTSYYCINLAMGYQTISNKFNLAYVCTTVLGMPAMMLALLINSHITVGEPKAIQLQVLKVNIYTPPDPEKWRAIVNYKNGLFDNYYFVRRIKFDDEWKRWKDIVYKVDKGFFGIYVVKEIKFIKYTNQE